MAIDIGFHIAWRWQGVKSCCWLTSIEMLMQHKHGNIYGPPPRAAHSPEALADYRANNGSHIGRHAAHYGLETNALLDGGDVTAWENALRIGPVLAEGHYGWSRFGAGLHVILIAGISRSKKLAFFNPNVFAVLPHPKDKITYFSIARCVELSDKRNLMGGPFWQTADDVALQRRGGTRRRR